jgi:glycolate oxidase iron-sulfur subunit
METHLAQWIKNTPAGNEAESILRACVHCGFCNATCPTYQVLGDELDGPRGRIYQIKQMLEGHAPTASTQLHLDRCLTCMNCETTCPSGVRYGRLVDIGRAVVDERVRRPLAQRLQHAFLRGALTRHWIVDSAVGIGRALRGVLPARLRAKLPVLRPAPPWPDATHARRVLLLNGCVQPALMPSIDAATARVLDAIGIQAIVEARSGCCGAISYHLDAQTRAGDDARRNIDAWWPHIESGIEAIVINASGCSAMVKQYAHLLHDDVNYSDKAQRVVELTRDVSEFLGAAKNDLVTKERQMPDARMRRVAFHPPCTLQHTQKIRGVVEGILTTLGAELVPVADAHLCCGSAGTYSLLQPQLSSELRDRKLENLQREKPAMILSSNIGCLAHLEGSAAIPVRHWIEWVDAVLAGPDAKPSPPS